jgi:hypothetical protein
MTPQERQEIFGNGFVSFETRPPKPSEKKSQQPESKAQPETNSPSLRNEGSPKTPDQEGK